MTMDARNPQRRFGCRGGARLLPPIAALAGLAAVLVASAPAHAQTQPPGVVPGIEERVRPEAPVSPLTVPPEELILTGQHDIVLLQQRQLFELHAASNVSFTDNGFLSDQHRVADAVFNNSAGLRAATQIGETVDVYAGFDVASQRHAVSSGLDFDDFAGSFGAGFPVNVLRLDFGDTITDVHSSGFGRHLLTLNSLAASVSYPMSYAGATIAPSLTVTRSLADPGAFTASEVRLGAGASYALSATVALFGQPSLFYRYYDNYFKNFTGVVRVDHGFDLPAGLVWTPLSFLSLSVQLDLSYNSSTFAPNSYEAFSAAPSVQLSYRF